MPLGLLDFTNMISAGKYWSCVIFTISPTLRFFQESITNVVVWRSRRSTYLVFSMLSARCLFKSSNISLTADTVMTNINGRRMVGWPFVIEI